MIKTCKAVIYILHPLIHFSVTIIPSNSAIEYKALNWLKDWSTCWSNTKRSLRNCRRRNQKQEFLLCLVLILGGSRLYCCFLLLGESSQQGIDNFRSMVHKIMHKIMSRQEQNIKNTMKGSEIFHENQCCMYVVHTSTTLRSENILTNKEITGHRTMLTCHTKPNLSALRSMSNDSKKLLCPRFWPNFVYGNSCADLTKQDRVSK